MITHVHYDDVCAETALWVGTGEIISDQVAVTIASWFMSPGTDGTPFTVLAQTGELTDELVDAIDRELRADHGPDVMADLRALRAYVTYIDSD